MADLTPEAVALLNKAKLDPKAAQGRGDTTAHDEAIKQLSDQVADLEVQAVEEDRTHKHNPKSARNRADALRRELNHAHYVK